MGETLGDRLKRLAKEAGLSDTELAAVLGYPHSNQASRLFGGTTKTLKLDRALALCDELTKRLGRSVTPWELQGKRTPLWLSLGSGATKKAPEAERTDASAAEREAPLPADRQREIARRVDRLWEVYLASDAGAADRKALEKAGRLNRRASGRRQAEHSGNE